MSKKKNTAPARARSIPAIPTMPKPGSLEDLDRLSGYTGSIQGTHLDTAIDEQRTALWFAQSVIDLAVGSLENEFGVDWPAKLPDFPRALREVSRIISSVTGSLETAVLEDRALEIARAAEASHGH